MMDKYKISADEFAKVSFERMATRPNTATSRGESGMSQEALKKRFDAPSRLLRDKFNALIALIAGEGDKESLLDYLQTGIDEGKSLREVLADITAENGAFASYLSVGDTTLAKKLAQLEATLWKPRGTYDESMNYKSFDVVEHDGSSYIVLKDVVGVTPSGGDYYMLLASKGGTPVRGTDYWTPEDVAAMKSDIDNQFGDVEATLDSIIAIQESLILPDGDEVSY